MPEETPSGEFDVEAAISAFLADSTATELQLPPLETEQRKKAKKLAEEFSEVKCESYGFGPERRLHLFKNQELKGAKEPASNEVLRGQCSEGSTISGAVPEEKTATSPRSEEGVVALSHGYQVRNTFIHIEGADIIDQRAVQSMPHGMFSQCLQEEGQIAQGSMAGSTKEVTVPRATPPADAPKEIFAPGTEVVIEGLTKFPAFNGLHGTVLSMDSDSGRYNVQLSSADGSVGQSAKIKGENLRMTVPPPPPFESTASRTDFKSTLQARAPDFVPMSMAIPSVPPTPWQDRPMQPFYDHHAHYDPYPYPGPPMFAAR